jgi:nucleolar complex protein 2
LKYSALTYNHFLGIPEEKVGQVLPSSTKKWKKIKNQVKSLLNNLLSLIKQMTAVSMTKFVLKSTESLIPYFSCYPKIAKDLLSCLLGFWSSSPHEQIRILAFLSIRKLALVSPNPYLDLSIKVLFFINCFRNRTKPFCNLARIPILTPGLKFNS